jgi:hypothetical protein
MIQLLQLSGGMDKRNEGSDSEATLIRRNGRRKLRRRTHHADMHDYFSDQESESDQLMEFNILTCLFVY